jgi:hypothetical protein
MNTQTTKHNLIINGFAFEIVGYHELRFKSNSKMSFDLRLITNSPSKGNYIGRKDIKISDFRNIANELIARLSENEIRKQYNNRFNGFSLQEIMANKDFRYGRIVVGDKLANYVNIYCYDKYSPTGVCLITSCSEYDFDIAAQATGNSHNYLVGSEGRRVVQS